MTEKHHPQCPWAFADPERLRSICGCPPGWPLCNKVVAYTQSDQGLEIELLCCRPANHTDGCMWQAQEPVTEQDWRLAMIEIAQQELEEEHTYRRRRLRDNVTEAMRRVAHAPLTPGDLALDLLERLVRDGSWYASAIELNPPKNNGYGTDGEVAFLTAVNILIMAGRRTC